MRQFALLLAGLIVLAVPRIAWSHKPSDSHVVLERRGADVTSLRWDIAVRDLSDVVPIDDGDGKVTWGELVAAQRAIERLALAALTLDRGGACTLTPRDMRAVQHSDGGYVSLQMEVSCPSSSGPLGVDYGLFFDRDAQHRGLLRVGDDATAATYVLGQGDGDAGRRASGLTSPRTVTIDVTAAAGTGELVRFVREGVWHIAHGYDHLLFLIALLLPSVLRRTPEGWDPVVGLTEVCRDVLRVVTAFTLAHSMTLSLAVIGVVHLPSRLVECGIAASVVLAALNNIVPLFGRTRWLAAFGLGLLHGFGFSETLVDLGLSSGSLVVALLGFNLGVELGQLAMVVAFVPLAFLVRRSSGYRQLALPIGSSIIAVLAAAWLFERAFDLRVLPG